MITHTVYLRYSYEAIDLLIDVKDLVMFWIHSGIMSVRIFVGIGNAQ